ncbi:hypothetical protein ONS95_002996 [Cadophora gregata]|uniref:uncharacterized protein n=1 Tax=Cadophora gregata TaxID=51156 RepID=UPI0026DBD2FF|nr:uncharacterized protein ONS95_002996 [Cadophora gregata]KAK0108174.1 hypothetical protein ONS95_002996 [Cadophora gregata]KAK0109233.1 hypothetical protein ONS96_003055 [Cadophora gregata f. sp. sojae]
MGNDNQYEDIECHDETHENEEANLINIQYKRLLKKKNGLEERLKKIEEKAEEIKKGSSKKARKDKAKKGIKIDMPAQAAARQAGNLAANFIQTGKTAASKQKEVEI